MRRTGSANERSGTFESFVGVVQKREFPFDPQEERREDTVLNNQCGKRHLRVQKALTLC